MGKVTKLVLYGYIDSHQALMHRMSEVGSWNISRRTSKIQKYKQKKRKTGVVWPAGQLWEEEKPAPVAPSHSLRWCRGGTRMPAQDPLSSSRRLSGAGASLCHCATAVQDPLAARRAVPVPVSWLRCSWWGDSLKELVDCMEWAS